MHKRYSKFLILSFVGVSIFGVYSYFYNDLKSEASSESSIVSSLDINSLSVSDNASNKAAEDTAFLMKLASLTRINIDTSLFEEKTFSSLVDNNIKIEPVPYGRINPFSPTEKSAVVKSSPVKTLEASQITTISAVLNGTIEGSVSNNIYFEYGTTENLGKVTSKVIPSLVGGIAYNISGLTPKTTYFFRATSNINGVLTFGETMSFNTK